MCVFVFSRIEVFCWKVQNKNCTSGNILKNIQKFNSHLIFFQNTTKKQSQTFKSVCAFCKNGNYCCFIHQDQSCYNSLIIHFKCIVKTPSHHSFEVIKLVGSISDVWPAANTIPQRFRKYLLVSHNQQKI